MRRLSAPSAFYAALSIAMVIFFGFASLIQRQPPAPVVAEIAPHSGAPLAQSQTDHAIPATAPTVTNPQPPNPGNAARGPAAARAGPGQGTSRATRNGAFGPAGGGGAPYAGSGTFPSPPPAAGSTSGGAPAGSGPPGPGPGSGTGPTPTPTPTPSPSATPSPTPCTDCMTVSAPCTDPNGVTQTDDPQSPRCIPTWTGHQPTASSRGVTKDTITVAHPSGVFYGSGNTNFEAIWTDMETYFNTHYMFYGRKLKLVGYTQNGNSTYPAAGANPGTQRADAEEVNQLNAFASVGTNYDIAGNDYQDQLARDHIVSTSTNIPSVSKATLDNNPYEWSYLPTLEEMEKAAGNYICGQLGAGAPSHAGTAPPTATAPWFPTPGTTTPRKYGYLINTFPDDTNVTDTTVLDSLITSCTGSAPAVKAVSAYGGASNGDANAQMLSLRAQGVTTIICLCHINAARLSYMPAATSQNYQPEWFFTTFLHNDMARTLDLLNGAQKESGYAPGPPPTGDPQIKSSFGLSFFPEATQKDNLYVTKALSYATGGQFKWTDIQAGQGADYAAQVWEWYYYKSLMMLASGVQLAGPTLTPQSFAAGLQGTPGSDAPGIGSPFPGPATSEGRVGFPGHSMIQDAATMWWDPNFPNSPWGNSKDNGTSPVGPGTWCYANAGLRHGFGGGGWPGGIFSPTPASRCS